MDEEEQAVIRKIRQQQQSIELLENELDDLKHESKRLKTNIKAARLRLSRMINGEPEDQLDLPLEDGEIATSEHAALLAMPIEEAITLTEKQMDKLTDAGVQTVGQFEQLRAGNREYPRGLLDLPGVAEKTITKWEEQIIEFLSQAKEPAGAN